MLCTLADLYLTGLRMKSMKRQGGKGTSFRLPARIMARGPSCFDAGEGAFSNRSCGFGMRQCFGTCFCCCRISALSGQIHALLERGSDASPNRADCVYRRCPAAMGRRGASLLALTLSRADRNRSLASCGTVCLASLTRTAHPVTPRAEQVCFRLCGTRRGKCWK